MPCGWDHYSAHINQLPADDQARCQRAGGDSAIHYLQSYWKLAPDEALLINAHKVPNCTTWNFQLSNYWMESLDYRYHRISVNKHTAARNSDGSVTVVVAHSDPGADFPNWLSTTGHDQGGMLWRWVEADEHPPVDCRVVKLADLKAGFADGDSTLTDNSPSVPEVTLDSAAMLAEARAQTGLSNFGCASFRPAFECLVAALNAEAELNPLGRFMQFQRILNSLKNRLRMESWIEQHPEILHEKLAPPVVIVGLTRTGTTMLHRILASDTRFHAPLWYEVRNPAPYMDWQPDEPDQRIVEARAEVAALLESNPEIASIHPMDPIGADEEILLLEHSFYSYVPNSFAHVPNYGRFVAEADNTPAYEYLKRQLQFLQWQKTRRGESAERWLLKAPHHLHFMSTLLQVFPDIQVVATHRDPVVSIPSTASLYYNLWLTGNQRADKHVVGREVLDVFSRGTAHTLSARATKEAQFTDVHFENTVTKPHEVIEQIYAFINMALTPESLQAMDRHREENQRSDRPAHAYTLEEYGYTKEEIRSHFTDYCTRFIP